MSKLTMTDIKTGKSMEFDGLRTVDFSPNLSTNEKQTYSLNAIGEANFECDAQYVNMNPLINDFDIEFDAHVPVTVQSRKHKKHRINKKWLKRYGYKTIYQKIKIKMSDCEIDMHEDGLEIGISSNNCILG